MFDLLQSYTAEEITAIITAITAGVVAIIGAIIKLRKKKKSKKDLFNEMVRLKGDKKEKERKKK